MNILLNKSCLLNIHEELEEKAVMNMNKPNLVGFLCKEKGRHSILLSSRNSISSTYNDIHVEFSNCQVYWKAETQAFTFLVNYQCFSAEGSAYIQHYAVFSGKHAQDCP